MRVRVASIWEEIRSSYWFVPALMAMLAIAISFATVALDERLDRDVIRTFELVWTGGPEGARELLSTVAGSMITVAGVTFSITIVAFSQASSQFGPHLLRSFMRDTGNQIVLGTFVATFTYCLLVLRTVRGGNNGDEVVPYISITLAVVLALASLGVLIYFFHHASRSIQAPVVIASVAKDLFGAIECLFPSGIGQVPPDGGSPNPESDAPHELDSEGARIVAPKHGYMLALDSAQLLELATRHDLVIRLMFRPGQFVARGDLVLAVWPPNRVSRDLAEQLEQTFILGRERTPTQDVEYVMEQLVEVAVRALSPSTNDPFTAMICVDWLGAALSRLAEKDLPSPYRYDAEGRLRVVVHRPLTFPGLVDSALDQIRQYAGESQAVRVRLLEAIAMVILHTHTAADRRALIGHAALVRRGSEMALSEKDDLQEIETRYRQVMMRQAEEDSE